jgi:hypothetical protein
MTDHDRTEVAIEIDIHRRAGKFAHVLLGAQCGCKRWAKTAAVWTFVPRCHDPPAVFHLEVKLA